MNLLEDVLKNWQKFSVPSSKIAVCKILAHFNAQTFEYYYFAKDYILTQDEFLFLEHVFNRLKRDEPLSKILGVSSFYGRDFIINEDVLDPRPDSECLIDVVLTYHKDYMLETILDLGTGSGCLIISLLLEIPKIQGVGVDFSEKALDIAQQNIKKFGVKDRIQLMKSNWFSNVSSQKFDGIISNPPYISSNYNLHKSVLDYDPHTALFSGYDGLNDYRLIFKDLPNFLKPDGFFFGEIGFDQKEKIKKELENHPLLMFIECVKDLNGHDRVVVIKKI
jgi:release factor glutamine methyltransferase